MGDSQDASRALSNFRAEMEGDFKLLARKKDWQDAVKRLLKACVRA